MRRLSCVVMCVVLGYALAGCVIVVPPSPTPTLDTPTVSTSGGNTPTPPTAMPQPATTTPPPPERQPTTYQVPDVIGMYEADARAQLAIFTNVVSQQAFNEPIGSTPGTVVDIDPTPGMAVTKDQQITLYIATGNVTLPPSLVGTSVDAALVTLGQLGIGSSNVRIVYQVTDSAYPGTVIAIDPPTGSAVSRGTPITLYVAKEATFNPSTYPTPS